MLAGKKQLVARQQRAVTANDSPNAGLAAQRDIRTTTQLYERHVQFSLS